MTPKEKAKELFHKYWLFFVKSDAIGIKTKAIQCAIIAVDEILNNDGFTQCNRYTTEFWQEVKQEILNGGNK
jgi:hypothetical protein